MWFVCLQLNVDIFLHYMQLFLESQYKLIIACVYTFLFLQAEIFLNLLSQFKELGFPEEKIFDALKKSEGDSNKTLDILTCAG